VRRQGGRRTVSVDGQVHTIDAVADGRVRVDGTPMALILTRTGDEVWAHVGGRTHRWYLVPATRHADASEMAGAGTLTSPMPGAVLDVRVGEGDHVTAGQVLVVVEAMKMEHPVAAPADGVTIVEVGPRDGLQNEPGVVPTDVKVGVHRPARRHRPVGGRGHLVRAPRWVPQLADAAEVLAGITPSTGCATRCWSPTRPAWTGRWRRVARGRGVRRRVGGVQQRNLNRTIDESWMFAPVVRRPPTPGCGCAATCRWCAAARTRARCPSTT
jgi:hypothetical protein